MYHASATINTLDVLGLFIHSEQDEVHNGEIKDRGIKHNHWESLVCTCNWYVPCFFLADFRFIISRRQDSREYQIWPNNTLVSETLPIVSFFYVVSRVLPYASFLLLKAKSSNSELRLQTEVLLRDRQPSPIPECFLWRRRRLLMTQTS